MSSIRSGRLSLLHLSLVLFLFSTVDSAGINAFFHFRCQKGPCPRPLGGKINVYWSPVVANDEDILGPKAKIPLLNLENALIHSQDFSIESEEERLFVEKPAGAWEVNMDEDERYQLLVIGATNGGSFYVPNSQFQRQMAGCVKQSRVRCQFHFDVEIRKK